MTGARALLRRLRGENRGLALIEFAMVLPFMILLYLGSFEISDGISCSRKVTIATRALADLVAQSVSGSTSASEVNGDLSAAMLVMTPYSQSNATARVTQFYTDNNQRTTVVWSRGLNTTGYLIGSVATLPANLQVQNTYLIYSEVTYAYTPPVSFDLVKPMTFSSNLYMLPRNTSSITCLDC